MTAFLPFALVTALFYGIGYGFFSDLHRNDRKQVRINAAIAVAVICGVIIVRRLNQSGRD